MTNNVRKIFGIIVLLFVTDSYAVAANYYATIRLQKIANSLSNVPFDQLSQGIHAEFCYKGFPLNVRVNEWDEIEHIGYHIFDSLFVRHQPLLICDFVERYLLELDLDNKTDRNLRLGIDKVIVEEGTMKNMRMLSSVERIDLSMVEMQRYRVAWYKESLCLLSLVFDMDYQLLSGCNAIELEYNYLRNLGRLKFENQWQPKDIIADSTDEYAIVDGGHYLSETIRGDLYYQRDSVGAWHLVCGHEKPYWSAANLLLVPINTTGDFQLDGRLDMYGYRDTIFKVDVYQWVAQTLSEGCQMYFGIKSRTPKVIRGTVFCPNPSAGYCHMMSVKIPVEAFDDKQGVIEGRLFAYVPLHNIDEGYFDLEYLQPE